jgi:hypothetical protein
MTSVLYCLSIVGGLVFRKAKLITIFILMTMFILAAFKTTDADMINYLNGYYAAGSDEGRYVGFTLFIKIISSLNLDFEQYLCIFYLIVFGILLIGIRKLTKNINFVLASYLISCYAMEVVQMKSALADSIVLFAFAYYFGNGNQFSKKRASVTACLLFLAVFIHFSVVFYLGAFLLYLSFKGRQYYFIKILLITIICMFLFSEIGLGSILSIGSTLGMLGNDNEYLSRWFEQGTRLGFLIPFLEVFFIIAPYLLLQNKERIEEERNTFRELKLFMYTIVLTLPLLFLNVTFTRLFRVYLILSSVIVSDYGIRLKYKPHEFCVLLLFFISLIYAFFIDTFQSWETTLGALLNANGILPF